MLKDTSQQKRPLRSHRCAASESIYKTSNQLQTPKLQPTTTKQLKVRQRAQLQTNS